MKYSFLFILIGLTIKGFAQTSYTDSLHTFLKEYKEKHEVVKGDDKARLHFFKIDPAYRVLASFEKTDNSPWFQMPTSGLIKKLYRVYGIVHFKIGKPAMQLNLYQSQDLLQNAQYKAYLFLPFTDLTSGKETYDGGRYIDLTMEDIKNNQVVIDFNKAYNPYCAYISGKFNCPIPPKENHLSIAIKAGEKAFKE